MPNQKAWSYQTGLAALDQQVDDSNNHAAFAALAELLRENLQEERRFGSTSAIRAARAGIVRQMNALTLDSVGVSFNSFCLVETDHESETPQYDLAFAVLHSCLPVDDRLVLLEFLDLEYRLWASVTNHVRYGPNEQSRREQADLLAALDQLSRAYTKQPFTALILEPNPRLVQNIVRR